MSHASHSRSWRPSCWLWFLSSILVRVRHQRFLVIKPIGWDTVAQAQLFARLVDIALYYRWWRRHQPRPCYFGYFSTTSLLLCHSGQQRRRSSGESRCEFASCRRWDFATTGRIISWREETCVASNLLSQSTWCSFLMKVISERPL